jgi:hypothetical protein
MGKLWVSLNQDFSWPIDPPLSDEVWRRLGLKGRTLVMASDVANAIKASTSSPPAHLKPLLDDIRAEADVGDESMMVMVEAEG